MDFQQFLDQFILRLKESAKKYQKNQRFKGLKKYYGKMKYLLKVIMLKSQLLIAIKRTPPNLSGTARKIA
jgi:hypothetical protein